MAAVGAEAAASRRSERGRRWLRYGLAAAVAVPVLGLGVALGTGVLSTEEQQRFDGTLSAGSARSVGEVELTRTDSGWRVRLDAEGLPRRAEGRYYQAWLLRDGEAVSVGTFNESRDVTLWAGVSPRDFGTLVVTQEQVGDTATGLGTVVLRAELHPDDG